MGTLTPSRSAVTRTLRPAAMSLAFSKCFSGMCRRASGVPVRALKVLAQPVSRQRKRCRPFAWPSFTNRTLPQCGHALTLAMRACSTADFTTCPSRTERAFLTVSISSAERAATAAIIRFSSLGVIRKLRFCSSGDAIRITHNKSMG